jgi:hypothetical protein
VLLGRRDVVRDDVGRIGADALVEVGRVDVGVGDDEDEAEGSVLSGGGEEVLVGAEVSVGLGLVG